MWRVGTRMEQSTKIAALKLGTTSVNHQPIILSPQFRLIEIDSLLFSGCFLN
jgi:hypothetical protein